MPLFNAPSEGNGTSSHDAISKIPKEPGTFAAKLQNSLCLKIVCLNMIKYFILCSSEVCLRTRAAVTVETCCLVSPCAGACFAVRSRLFGKHRNICEVCVGDVPEPCLQFGAQSGSGQQCFSYKEVGRGRDFRPAFHTASAILLISPAEFCLSISQGSADDLFVVHWWARRKQGVDVTAVGVGRAAGSCCARVNWANKTSFLATRATSPLVYQHRSVDGGFFSPSVTPRG